MKRYHVIGLAILAGFVAGLAVPAHADILNMNGRYVCGNTGLSVTIATDPSPHTHGGRIGYNSFVNITDEAENLTYSGSIEFSNLNDGPYGLLYVSGGDYRQIFRNGPGSIRVYQDAIKGGQLKPIASTALYCSK